MESENQERFIKMYSEFNHIMDVYRSSSSKDMETMSYFRAINDNLSVLKSRLIPRKPLF